MLEITDPGYPFLCDLVVFVVVVCGCSLLMMCLIEVSSLKSEAL